MKDHRKERAEARKKAEKLVSQMTLLEKASQLKYDAAPVKRLGVPAYNYWNEALHGVARAGVATMFPQAIAMAAVFDDEEMKKVGDIICREIIVVKDTNMRMKRYKLVRCFWTRSSRELEHSVSSYTQNMV